MDDYVCLTVLSEPGEGESAFASRLSEFWTHMLRDMPADFERVYAEMTRFERIEDRLSRKYLVEAKVANRLVAEMGALDLAAEPVDHGDLYSKYEATPPDWMQIEH